MYCIVYCFVLQSQTASGELQAFSVDCILAFVRQILATGSKLASKDDSHTYIDFYEYCTNKHSEAMENISKSVKKGCLYGYVGLAVMIAVMGMDVQQTNDSRRDSKKTITAFIIEFGFTDRTWQALILRI